MKKINLKIVDIQKNVEFKNAQSDYILLGPGSLKNLEGKKILLTEKQDKFQKNINFFLIDSLYKKIKNLKLFFIEFEIFNLRNDKIKFFDIIINTIIIKKYINLKKYKSIEFISDNKFAKNIFKKNKKIKTSIKAQLNEKKNYIFFSFVKFISKLILIKLYLIFYKTKVLKYEDCCLSIYPIFYKKNKENFFNKNEYLKLNFLLTDETHLNHDLYKIIQIIKKSKSLGFINIEQFITTADILKSCLFFLFNYFASLLINKKLVIQGLDFSRFYSSYFNESLLNRSKLLIYEKCMPRILKKTKLKRFHLWLFEYNFGYFLINNIKKFNKNIEIIGYQHGIFSYKLMWLDLLSKFSYFKRYCPNKILALNKQSFLAYKNVYKNNVKAYLNVDKKKSTISKKIQKLRDNNSKNILFFPGTHDLNELLNALSNYDTKSINKIYIKLHPKSKIKKKHFNKKIKLIKFLTNQKFNKVLLSPTTTIAYDLLREKIKFSLYKLDYKPNLLDKKYLKNTSLTII